MLPHLEAKSNPLTPLIAQSQSYTEKGTRAPVFAFMDERNPFPGR